MEKKLENRLINRLIKLLHLRRIEEKNLIYITRDPDHPSQLEKCLEELNRLNHKITELSTFFTISEFHDLKKDTNILTLG